MSGRWFRLYDDLLDDPKVQRLPADLFRALVNSWCLASKHGGILPSISDVSFCFRVSENEASELISKLQDLGFIDKTKRGLVPHNWQKRQFKTDVSTERVKRFRERSMKRDETVSETPPDTETEQSQIQNRTEKTNGAHAPSSDCQKAFENFNRMADHLALSKANALTKDRKRKLDARLSEVGLSGWNIALENLADMPFCCGKNERGWKVNFDWLLSPTNLNKVIEKAYARAENPN